MPEINVSGYSAEWLLKAMTHLKKHGKVTLRFNDKTIEVTKPTEATMLEQEKMLCQIASKLKE